MQPSIDLRAGGQSIVIQPVSEDDENDFYDIKILEPLSSAASGIGDWLQVHFVINQKWMNLLIEDEYKDDD